MALYTTEMHHVDRCEEEAVTARTCQRWHVKLHFCDFSLKDQLRSGSPSDVYDDVLGSMIRTNPTLTSTEVSFKLGIPQNIALDYIKGLGFVPKLFVWVPQELRYLTTFCTVILQKREQEYLFNI
ncbi:hypothetical protein TNCV_2562011 [Trichonephila clavipes]|uniref:Uncharacterized protein n=1 Tax=Trichonephila clavipes TaxID=2585209 RepID=A0A8X6R6G5_TRICX|nr:hypothetical protein TNCV_2562011 [Trichonephila clavipes]